MWPLPVFPGPASASPPACEAALVCAVGTGGPARAPLMDVPHPRPCQISQLPAPTVRVSTLVLLGETLRLSWPRRELVTPSDQLAGGQTGPTGDPVCRVGSIRAAMVLPMGSMWPSQ